MLEFHEEWRDYETERDSLYLQFDSLSELANGLEQGIFQTVEKALNMTRNFLQNGRITKKNIAAFFIQDQVQITFVTLISIFDLRDTTMDRNV